MTPSTKMILVCTHPDWVDNVTLANKLIEMTDKYPAYSSWVFAAVVPSNEALLVDVVLSLPRGLNVLAAVNAQAPTSEEDIKYLHQQVCIDAWANYRLPIALVFGSTEHPLLKHFVETVQKFWPISDESNTELLEIIEQV